MKATRFRKSTKINKKVIAIPIVALSAFTVSLVLMGAYVSRKDDSSANYAKAAALTDSLIAYDSDESSDLSSADSFDLSDLDDTMLLLGRVDGALEEAESESYTVTWFESAIPVYANNNVNLRLGPDTSYDIVTTVVYGTQLVATGKTDNGWYVVDYDGQSVYVAEDYMQDTEPEKLIIETDTTPSDIIFVGDSRTVGMEYAVNDDDSTWLCEVGKGYYWLKENIALIDDYATSGSKVIFNLGVNDLNNSSKYIELINSYMDLWTSEGIEVYYSAVTPVGDTTVTNDQIESFNNALKEGLDDRITWIDSYSFLTENGFSSSDGLHYNNATYVSLYNYYLSVIE